MAETKPQLGYWSTRGASGPQKCLLAHLGVDYEFVEYVCGGAPDWDRSSWMNVKFTLGLPYPNLPYWIDGDLKISEQAPILRAICAKYKPEYLGRTLAEQGHADMYCNLLKEQFFLGQVAKSYPQGEEHDETMKTSAKDFATQFNAFRGENKFCVGNEPTYPDFMTYEWIQRCAAHDAGILEAPGIAAYKASMEELPGIEAYNKVADTLKWNNPMARYGA